MEEQYKEELQDRLTKCIEVVDSLESTKAWQILLEDTKKQQDQIDRNWQDVGDDKMATLKSLKRATMHVMAIPDQYRQEKETIIKELETINNPESEIVKDYDSE